MSDDPHRRPPLAVPRPPDPPGAASSAREIRGSMFIDTEAGTFKDLRPPPPPVMSRREFEAELQGLLRDYAGDA